MTALDPSARAFLKARALILTLIPLLAFPLAAQEGTQEIMQDPWAYPATEPAAAATDEPPAQDFFAGMSDEEPEPEPEEPGRTTIVPWALDVLGKNYESFPNNEASRVLSDWLVNSLIHLNVFNVVNRDKIQAVLSEQQLAATGYSVDVSPAALADAGKLLKVNYILFGNFKNLGKTSEVDFKLLDVDTTTYTHAVNFTIPFNASIESMKPEIDRIVAELAAHFPVVANVREITDARHLSLDAGTASGIRDAMEVEMWKIGGRAPVATGFVTRATAADSEVELDRDVPEIDLFDYVAHIKIVPPAQAALKKGLRDLEKGQYRAAAASFQKGLEADPDDGLLHANYARSCWQSGDYKNAVDAFRKAIALRPDDVALLEDAATAMLESGQITELIEVLEHDGRRAYSHRLGLVFGQAREILGYPERARDAYKAVLKDDPNNGETHFRLAVLAVKRGELEEAEREFRLAQANAGDSLEMELGLAAFRSLQTAPGEAKTRLAPILERAQAERDVAALTSAGEVLLMHGPLWGLSLELAQKSLGFNPDYMRATLASARAYAAGGQKPQAISLINDALRTYPNSVALLLLSGQLLTEEENYIEAESRFRQAQDLAPEDWRPSKALAEIYTLRQDHLKAVRAYLDVLERSESSSDVDVTAHLHKLGKAAVMANQLDTAEPYLERCVAGAPDNLECQYYLGVCYFSSENPEKAERAIASFKVAGINDSAYYLGALYERKEDFKSAIEWYRRCEAASQCVVAEGRRRLDALESITGTVQAVKGQKPAKATLDVGRIHGVTHAQEGIVVHGTRVVGRVRVEEVQDKTSVAVVLKGDPLVGQKVRFRPSRPRDVTVQPMDRKGVQVRWRSNPEAEVEFYEVLQATSPGGPWKIAKKVKHPNRELTDKSAKRGSTYYYRVVAITETKTRSLPSDVIQVKTK